MDKYNAMDYLVASVVLALTFFLAYWPVSTLYDFLAKVHWRRVEGWFSEWWHQKEGRDKRTPSSEESNRELDELHSVHALYFGIQSALHLFLTLLKFLCEFGCYAAIAAAVGIVLFHYFGSYLPESWQAFINASLAISPSRK